MGWSSCRLTLPRRKLHPAGRQGSSVRVLEEVPMLRIKPHVPKVIPTNLVERAGGRLLLRHLGDRRGWWRLLLGFSLLLNPGERKTSVQVSHYRGDQETPLQNEGQGAHPAINCCGHRRTGLAGPRRASEMQQSTREKGKKQKAHGTYACLCLKTEYQCCLAHLHRSCRVLVLSVFILLISWLGLVSHFSLSLIT